MDLVRAIALVAATLTTGLMTGVFYLYAVAIMPGLGRAGDRTFVGAFQSVDRAIINPLFLSTFFGPLLFTGWPPHCTSPAKDDRCSLGRWPRCACTWQPS